ncbi:MAG TPA: M24 family metallopeptidase, partial [Ignisphaera sp.]|nr:M24 family metallopeptidase [Ignisphaera sp.]
SEFEQVTNVVDAVCKAIDAVLQNMRAGVIGKDMDRIAREILRKHNELDRYFIHGLGHGIGIDVHEEPSLSSASEHVLEEGNVVTVEPGVYLRNKFGVRIEEDIVVTNKGIEKLTKIKRVLEI